MSVFVFNRGASGNIGDQLINFIIRNDLEKQGTLTLHPQAYPSPQGKLQAVHVHLHSYLTDVINIWRSDKTMIGGGNLIMDGPTVGTKWAFHHFWLSAWNLLLGKPYEYSYVGAETISHSFALRLYRFALRHASSISARDTRSKQYLELITARDAIQLIPDPVLKIASLYPGKQADPSSVPAIGICPVALFPRISQDLQLHHRYNCFIAQLADRLIESGAIVTLFLNSPDVDSPVLSEILSQLSHSDSVRVLEKFENLYSYLDFISSQSFIITARMHAAICAASYNTPNIGMGWQSKMKSFYMDQSLPGYLDLLELLSKFEASQLADLTYNLYKQILRGQEPSIYNSLGVEKNDGRSA